MLCPEGHNIVQYPVSKTVEHTEDGIEETYVYEYRCSGCQLTQKQIADINYEAVQDARLDDAIKASEKALDKMAARHSRGWGFFG